MTAVQENGDNADNRPVWQFSKMTTKNCDRDALFKFYDPKPDWLEYKIGNCRIINCNGPYNSLVRDLDGTILGKPSSIFSNNPNVTNGTNCVRNDKWNGYSCENNIPTKFDWGLVSFEVLNWKKDLFRPFIINNTQFYNNVTPNIDNKQEVYDISGERFPRYQTLIRFNRDYQLSSVGRKPKTWKFQLQYGDDDHWVVMEIFYGGSQSIKVTKAGTQITPVIAQSENPEDVNAALGSKCGNHAFVDNNKRIKFVLTGEDDCII
jgi:hypothetical protein